MNLGKLARVELLCRTKFILPLGLCLVVGTLGVVGFEFYQAREVERQHAEEVVSNLALGLSRDLAGAVDTFDLSTLAARKGMNKPDIVKLTPELRQSVLFDGSVEAKGFGGIVITDKAGTIVYDSTSTIPRSFNIADRDYYKYARDQPEMELVFGQPFKNNGENEWTLGLARSFKDSNGVFAGVIAGNLKLSFVKALFDKLELGKLGTINLFSLSGQLLLRHPYSEKDIGRDMSGIKVFHELSRSGSGLFVSTPAVDGVGRLYAYQRVGVLPLVICVGVSTDAVYREWTRNTEIIAGALSVLLLAGLAFTWALRVELRRARAEQAFRCFEKQHAEALARLDVLFQQSDDSMLIARVDGAGALIYEAVNPVWERITGVKAAMAIGRTPNGCLPERVAKEVTAKWEECREERRSVTFGLETHFDGPPTAWEIKIVPILDPAGKVSRLIGVARDVTQRKAAEDKLAALNLELALQATTDGLTGLANRRRLDEVLGLEWRRAARDGSSLSMLMIDLDRFKLFNDRYGHQQGDACLQAVAGVLGRFLRRPGDLAARYGGEELGVVLPNTDSTQAVLLAERVREAIEAAAIGHECNGPSGVVTASIGVATFKPFATSSAEAAAALLSAADEALYDAKHNGRNQVVLSKRAATDQLVFPLQLSS